MDNKWHRLFQQKDLSFATGKFNSALGEHARAWKAISNNFSYCIAAKK